jgi:sulfite reductase alpha subunit-like flavoprotein
MLHLVVCFWLYRCVLDQLNSDLCFQAEKVYVQHKLLAAKQEVWTLLEKGAYLYICGWV